MKYNIEQTLVLTFELLCLALLFLCSSYFTTLLWVTQIVHSTILLLTLRNILAGQPAPFKKAATYWVHAISLMLLTCMTDFSKMLPIVFEGTFAVILYHFGAERRLPVQSEQAKRLEKEDKRGSLTRSSFIGVNPIRVRGTSFSEEEKWLDIVDQGYFILRRDFSLTLINKKGVGILREFHTTFSELSERLREVEEPKRNLKTIIKSLLDAAPEGGSAKTMLEYAEESTERLKIDLFMNYKAYLVKLPRGCVLVVLKEKNQSSRILLSEKITKVTNCTLSHELKTLLNGIIGNLELLEDSIQQEYRLHYRVALSSSHILSSRLNDLLDYMQIQAHGLKLHYEEFEIETFIRDMANICEWQAEQKRIKFYLSKGRSLPPTMIGDRIRIQQVLLNLLNKSIDFMDFGTIKLCVYPQGEGYICFKVISEGSGMHNRLWSKVAQSSPVNRRDKYMTMEKGPTQNIEEMYLEISQLICRQMGTKIVVESKENGNSELALVLRDGFPHATSPQIPPALVHTRRYSIHERKINNENAFERTQYGMEGVLKCKKVENINIINVSVGPSSPLVTGQQVQSVLNQCFDFQSDSEEVPAEGEVDIALLTSHCLSPHKIGQSSCNNSSAQPSMVEKRVSSSNGTPDSGNTPLASMQLYPALLRTASRRGLSKREKIRRTTTADTYSIYKRHFKKLDTVEADDSPKILIVDDNSTNRLVLKSLLKKCGYNSMETNNGLEAVNLVNKYLIAKKLHELKLVFMDLQMPIMDGIKATDIIISSCVSAGYDAPPIIGISSDISEEDRSDFFTAGINEFLNKPIHRDQVVRLISKYIK